MTDLRIGKLPDRTPVKITFSAWPDLNQALSDYAAFYEQTYGEAETVAELVPFMLDSFLGGDRAFAKYRKEQASNVAPASQPSRRGRATSTRSSSTQAQEE